LQHTESKHFICSRKEFCQSSYCNATNIVMAQANKTSSDNPSFANLASDARGLVRRALKASLATLDPGTGYPYASLIIVATDASGAPILLISNLARHTRNRAGGDPEHAGRAQHPAISSTRASAFGRPGGAHAPPYDPIEPSYGTERMNITPMALTSFGSGALITTQGWTWLNLSSTVPVVAIAGSLLWLRSRHKVVPAKA
jgi:hypothetical protein